MSAQKPPYISWKITACAAMATLASRPGTQASSLRSGLDLRNAGERRLAPQACTARIRRRVWGLSCSPRCAPSRAPAPWGHGLPVVIYPPDEDGGRRAACAYRRDDPWPCLRRPGCGPVHAGRRPKRLGRDGRRPLTTDRLARRRPERVDALRGRTFDAWRSGAGYVARLNTWLAAEAHELSIEPERAADLLLSALSKDGVSFRNWLRSKAEE